TLVIDPPWQISMAGKRPGRHQRPDKLPYRTLTVKEIKTFPVSALANPGAHVYCWCTNRTLRDCFSVLDSWGIRFHLALPMVKRSGICPCNGWVFGSEFCLMGFFGKPMLPFVRMGKLNWWEVAPIKGRHSVKPDEFYSDVEAISPGPWLDMFSRKTRKGW